MPQTRSQASSEPDQDEVAIASIRAEIRALQKRKRFLSSSLLSSDSLQRHLSASSAAATAPIPTPGQSQPPSQLQIAQDASPLIQTAASHAESNHHRIAFSTTAFPFEDPAPTSSHDLINDNGSDKERNLIGLRLDVSTRTGRFTKPYYVLFKRVTEPAPASASGPGAEKGRRWLRVHRHTIPAFIPVDKLARVYLPSPHHAVATDKDNQQNAEEEQQAQLKPWKTTPPKQNLHAFTRVLRRHLVSFHRRRDVIGLLRERLGVQHDAALSSSSSAENIFDDGAGDGSDDGYLPLNSAGLVSLSPTSLEARYVRLEWEDGRVGRFKVSERGVVERAVVIGGYGRDRGVEGCLRGGDGRVEGVVERLLEYGNGNTAIS